METLAVVDREAELALVPTGLESPRHDSTVAAFPAVDDAVQLIERSQAYVITVTVPKRRPLSILERFVLRAISLQAETRGKAVWIR